MSGYILISMLSFGGGSNLERAPAPPMSPTNERQCQTFRARHQEYTMLLSERSQECVREQAGSRTRVQSGSCCIEYAGDAANLGWCKVSQACAADKEAYYCAINSGKKLFEECMAKANGRAESDLGDTLGTLLGVEPDSPYRQEVEILQRQVDRLKTAAHPALRHNLARKLVDEAVRNYFNIAGEALRQYDDAMRSYEQGVHPGQQYWDIGFQREGISGACALRAETAEELAHCVTDRLMLENLRR